jgi:maleate isomerase
MKKRVFLGMLTPSSNTVLEPVTSAMVAGLNDVSAHFGRFRVIEISLAAKALGQFSNGSLLEAARLLADARVDVIAWNGTSAGWLGFEADRKLCREITAATGIPATTSTLALAEAFEVAGVARFALVTPYLDEIQEKIVANFASEGFACVAERHLNDKGNFSFSEVTGERIAGMVRDVAADKPQAITTYCTNFRGAPIVDELERDIGIPIFDSISVVVWKSLLLAGVDPRGVMGWGRLFSDETLAAPKVRHA